MRVLYFSQGYTTHDRRFLEKIAEAHEVWFLPLNGMNAAFENRGLPPGVKLAAGSSTQPRIASLDEGAALLSDAQTRIQPDLVHAGPLPSCAFIAALSGFRPLAIMSWGSDLLVEAKSDQAVQDRCRMAIRSCDLFICDAQEVADYASSLAPVEPDRVVRFPWGIELDRFRSVSRVPAHEGEELVVLGTRAWQSGYGIETQLEAFRLAFAQDDRLHLMLVGDGPLRSFVYDFRDRHNLSAAISLPGRVAESELPAYFERAHVYLSCAPADGTSISLLEALASGLPCIAVDRPSNREWICAGVNGWLADANDPGAFAACLLRAARLPERERAALFAANRGIAFSRADWSRNSQKLLDAYERVRVCDGAAAQN